ncbi:hypothetical protein [Bailinhaonella thermotolerans]|uniref:Uncharacterized protein n=1 Tax=Bailinhaonella thermotolerans TaxID=1070861 RepID=A0A3A4AR64_9ACTN|nr:hypothetical protein [Bailinhaonella thermotolerans]RJL30905.1 hypothetical protein D5H75_21660 [Bailinhaonella thermotolerans]
MSGNNRVRQVHRWLSIVFTVTVLVAIVAGLQEKPAEWLYYVPLFPLALQMFTGLYLFALPYVARRRADHTAREA